MENLNRPNYKKIYSDIIQRKFPHKESECEHILKKNVWTTIDVITINTMIFQTQDKSIIKSNQKHRSYTRSSVLEILDYQKENRLNNSQLSVHFNISRNTIAKWKKMFY